MRTERDAIVHAGGLAVVAALCAVVVIRSHAPRALVAHPVVDAARNPPAQTVLHAGTGARSYVVAAACPDAGLVTGDVRWRTRDGFALVEDAAQQVGDYMVGPCWTTPVCGATVPWPGAALAPNGRDLLPAAPGERVCAMYAPPQASRTANCSDVVFSGMVTRYGISLLRPRFVSVPALRGVRIQLQAPWQSALAFVDAYNGTVADSFVWADARPMQKLSLRVACANRTRCWPVRIDVLPCLDACPCWATTSTTTTSTSTTPTTTETASPTTTSPTSTTTTTTLPRCASISYPSPTRFSLVPVYTACVTGALNTTDPAQLIHLPSCEARHCFNPPGHIPTLVIATHGTQFYRSNDMYADASVVVPLSVTVERFNTTDDSFLYQVTAVARDRCDIHLGVGSITCNATHQVIAEPVFMTHRRHCPARCLFKTWCSGCLSVAYCGSTAESYTAIATEHTLYTVFNSPILTIEQPPPVIPASHVEPYAVVEMSGALPADVHQPLVANGSFTIYRLSKLPTVIDISLNYTAPPSTMLDRLPTLLPEYNWTWAYSVSVEVHVENSAWPCASSGSIVEQMISAARTGADVTEVCDRCYVGML